MDQGKPDLAEIVFRNALRLDEKDASIHVNLGLLAVRRGAHSVGVLEFEKALELDPLNSVAFSNIWIVALRFRDYQRAVEFLEAAVKAGLKNCTTAPALGYAYEGMQQGEKSLEQLGSAHDLCPAHHKILFDMGTIAMGQLGDNDRALAYFQHYTEAQPKLAKDHPVFNFIKSIQDMKAAAPQKERPPQEQSHGVSAGAES